MSDNNIANMKVGSREHAEFSRLLVNTIQEYAIFLLDPSGYIATWNPGAQTLKGYKPEEIIGKHFSVFYPQEDRDQDKPGWELKVAKKEGHVEDEGIRVRKDGTTFWANVVITALRDDDGKLVGFAKVTRDLSERRFHEEELRIANLQLQQQSTELQQLNQSKDEFISLASHQLRTPASGVKQFIGLLLEGYAGELTDLQRDYLQRANESNERQIDLINDMLRVAQVDAGRVDIQLSETNLKALIEDVVSEQNDTYKNRQQTVYVKMPEQDVIGIVDEKRFRMVIENLVDNASKYTPEGGKIVVSMHTTKTAIVITITDNGVGIDKESLTKLFRKFSRVPNPLSEAVGGSGLGLYWANEIVKLHGGAIKVKSELDKGTVFRISIPKVKAYA